MGRIASGGALALASGIVVAAGMVASPAYAAVDYTMINANIGSTPYTYTFAGGSFTFDGSGGFPNYLSVSTSGGAAVRTVFGSPSTDFVDRGAVVYDQTTLGGYGSFPTLTSVPYTNGDNFLGLKVTRNGQDYYGYAYTTNSMLNGIAFETMANTGIIATTSFPAAVPEPAVWALLLIGFGAIGASMRGSARKRRLQVAYH